MPLDIDIEIDIKKDIKEDILIYINKMPYIVQSQKNQNVYYICGDENNYEDIKDSVEKRFEFESVNIFRPYYIAIGKERIIIHQFPAKGNELKDIYKIAKYIYEKYKDLIINISYHDPNFDYPPVDITEECRNKGIDWYYNQE